MLTITTEPLIQFEEMNQLVHCILICEVPRTCHHLSPLGMMWAMDNAFGLISIITMGQGQNMFFLMVFSSPRNALNHVDACTNTPSCQLSLHQINPSKTNSFPISRQAWAQNGSFFPYALRMIKRSRKETTMSEFSGDENPSSLLTISDWSLLFVCFCFLNQDAVTCCNLK